MVPVAAGPSEASHTVEVAGQDNAIVARARDHSWVAVLQDGERITAEWSGQPEVMFLVGPGSYEVRSDGFMEEVSTRSLELPPISLEPSAAPRLRLGADAPDRHTVDGVGEIPADGQSYCTVTVERIRRNGEPAQAEEGAAEVFLRATGGLIMDSRGRKRIRSVRLRRGRATFRLVSEKFPRLVAIHAFDRHGQAAELPLEFV
jgi:hypothetical protein